MSDIGQAPEPSKLEVGDAFGEDIVDIFEQIREKQIATDDEKTRRYTLEQIENAIIAEYDNEEKWIDPFIARVRKRLRGKVGE
jgi:hypothetical protein